MKDILCFLMAGWLIFSCKAYSQPFEGACEKRSEVKFGLTHNQLLESSINTLVHKGLGLNSTYAREVEGCGLLQVFSATIGSGFLKSRYETDISTFHFEPRFTYSVLFNHQHTNPPLHIHWGAISNVNYNIEYYSNWDENHYYWISSYSLGAQFRIEYPARNRGKIRIEVALPLIALISRPPERLMNIQSSSEILDIMKTIHSEPSMVLPDKHFELVVSARYLVKSTGKIKPNFFWQLDFMHTDIPGSAKRKSLKQSLGIGLGF